MKPLTRCPICGSRRIHRVCETVEFVRKGARVPVPKVCFDRCDTCGESFFDHEANEKIDAIVFSDRAYGQRRKSA